MLKPYSQACINNRDAILNQLERIFPNPAINQNMNILELGSGTGQHAVYFSYHLPYLVWQTSDLVHNHAGIQCWLDEVEHVNCLPPIAIDVSDQQWPISDKYQGVFAANILHICAWETVELLFRHVIQAIIPNGLLVIYGPFNYDGAYTSDSNERFDQFLKASNPKQGIRDIERVVKQASDNGLSLIDDQSMPANNRLLVFQYMESE